MNTTVRAHIPYVNIAAEHAALKSELLQAVERVIDSGEFVLGAEVGEFERRFAELCGTRFAVAVNSGTDALILTMRALGIGPGDEVITAPNSFVATAASIVLVGAKPVFVDVRDDLNIDPERLQAAITARTTAILPIHLTGRPADMDPIMETAKREGLYIIEDCAQAVLAEYGGRLVGSFGISGCFSLHPLKTLSVCGDGGVITTNDETICEQLMLLRNHGLRTRNDCVAWSTNSRLATIHAAMLLVKLKYVHASTTMRRANAAFYQRELAGVDGLNVPAEGRKETAVYHTFVIQAERRDALKRFLWDNGVDTTIHYPVPIHLQRAAANMAYRRGSLPVAERQADHILSLPVYPGLSDEDLAHVAHTIRRFYGA